MVSERKQRALDAMYEEADEDGVTNLAGLKKAHKILYGVLPVMDIGLRTVDSYGNLVESVLDETGPYDERDLVSAELLEEIESGKVLT